MPLRRPSFWIKVALGAALVAAADILLFRHEPGLNLGLFGLAWTAALAAANPAVLRSRLGLAALVLAGAFAALQIERPTLVGWLLFGAGLGVAALAPRACAADVWTWSQRLAMAALKAVPGPFFDLQRLLRARARRRQLRLTAVLLAAILPVWGGAVFLWLFGMANPVISDGLASLSLPEPDAPRLVFWGVVAGLAWTVLRPRGLRRTLPLPGAQGDLDLPGVSTASIAVSLVVFNALFALQNGLDVAFLWSGARLPQGMSFAEYAHRGAYPLIATALLAGLFVLVFLRPGSKTATWPPVRWMVVAWVAQNVFLVASTMLRTLDYIDAYSLTRMRIAALLWMGLVGTGLVLIGWRLVRARSASWLINANVLAAAVVLAACSVVDLGAVAAAWNVRHAREVGGAGVALDLCYLHRLDGAAVVSLAELERRPLTPEFRERVSYVRRDMAAELAADQADWRGWRWRDARRMRKVERLVGPSISPRPGDRRGCDGRKPAPPSAPPPPRPLTPQPNPRT